MNIRFHKALSIPTLKQTNLFASVLVFLLCASISARAMIESPIIEGIRYVSLFLCAFFSIPAYGYVSRTAIAIFLCAAISGMLNLLFIGNSVYTNFLYTLLSIFVAFLLCSPRISPRCLLYSMYLHAFMVACRFAQYGLSATIYRESSNNYVSCHLLMTITVYYSLLECRGERIPKLPAFIVFILSVLAMGRGGVLSAGILLTGILFYSVKNIRPRYRIALVALLLVGTIAMIYVSSSWKIASRFQQEGMSDDGRFAIWTQYLHSVFNSNRYFWLGAKLEELPLAVHHENNLHNSFLNIHAYNGIVTFVFLFCLSLYTISFAIRQKRLILLICMASLFFRGLTDRLLWASLGTPFMIFFLMIPRIDSLYQTKAASLAINKSHVKTISRIQIVTRGKSRKTGAHEGISL